MTRICTATHGRGRVMLHPRTVKKVEDFAVQSLTSLSRVLYHSRAVRHIPQGHPARLLLARQSTLTCAALVHRSDDGALHWNVELIPDESKNNFDHWVGFLLHKGVFHPRNGLGTVRTPSHGLENLTGQTPLRSSRKLHLLSWTTWCKISEAFGQCAVLVRQLAQWADTKGNQR